MTLRASPLAGHGGAVRIRYRETGQGAPVVLLHGGTADEVTRTVAAWIGERGAE